MKTNFMLWPVSGIFAFTVGSLYAQDTTYQKAMSLYRENKLSEALPEFEAASVQDGGLKRPLAIAVTVQPGWYASDLSHMSLAGPYFIWTSGPKAKLIDTTLALAAFDDMQPDEFAGKVGERPGPEFSAHGRNEVHGRRYNICCIPLLRSDDDGA